ncbi:MAG: amidase, partial [Myxococcota bacterium]
VILGKTSCPLASYDWQSVHPHRGRAHNPYNLNRTPGGSSGGSAAALAARLTPPELGSDAAGSIRVPCHFSGVVGLRPTEGTLSVQGHARQPGAPHVPMQLVTAGPMARSVADLRLAYDVLARMTPGELGSWPTGESAPAQAEELRIGWAEGLPELMPDAATREVLRQARIRLEEAGITVVDRPVSFDSFELLALWGRLSGYDLRGASPWYGRLFPGNLGTLAILCARLGLNAMTRGLARGLTRSAHGHRLDLEARAAFVAAMDRFLEPVDAWVFPAGPMAAFTHRRPGARIEVDEQRLSYAVPLGLYQCPLSVAATPVVAVPAGLDAAGLPVGVQLVGRRFSDRRLLAVAEALENAFGTLPAPAMADRG